MTALCVNLNLSFNTNLDIYFTLSSGISVRPQQNCVSCLAQPLTRSVGTQYDAMDIIPPLSASTPIKNFDRIYEDKPNDSPVTVMEMDSEASILPEQDTEYRPSQLSCEEAELDDLELEDIQ